MNITGKNIILNKSNQEIFIFLTDFSNYKQLMPENTAKFESNEDGFIFALKNMPEVGLKLKEKQEFEKIVLTSSKESLKFTLEAQIKSVEIQKSEVILSFNGEFNPFIKMMVEKPLTNFINTLSENIQKL